MKAQERGGLQDDRGTDQPIRAHDECTHASNDAGREAEIRRPFPGPIEDQQLLLEEHRSTHVVGENSTRYSESSALDEGARAWPASKRSPNGPAVWGA
jgi:hypothetical protein